MVSRQGTWKTMIILILVRLEAYFAHLKSSSTNSKALIEGMSCPSHMEIVAGRRKSVLKKKNSDETANSLNQSHQAVPSMASIAVPIQTFSNQYLELKKFLEPQNMVGPVSLLLVCVGVVMISGYCAHISSSMEQMMRNQIALNERLVELTDSIRKLKAVVEQSLTLPWSFISFLRHSHVSISKLSMSISF